MENEARNEAVKFIEDNFIKVKTMMAEAVEKVNEKYKIAKLKRVKHEEEKKISEESIVKGAKEAFRIYANPRYPNTQKFVRQMIILLDKKVRDICNKAETKDKQVLEAARASAASAVLEELVTRPEKMLQKYYNLKKQYGEIEDAELRARFESRLERLEERIKE